MAGISRMPLALLRHSQPWCLMALTLSQEAIAAIVLLSSKVSRRLGNVFYMMNLPLSVPLTPAPGKPSDQPLDTASPLHCNSSGDTLDSPCSQDPETSKAVEQIVSESRENPCDTAGSQADFQMIAFQKSWADSRTQNIFNHTGTTNYKAFEKTAAAWNLCMTGAEGNTLQMQCEEVWYLKSI